MFSNNFILNLLDSRKKKQIWTKWDINSQRFIRNDFFLCKFNFLKKKYPLKFKFKPQMKNKKKKLFYMIPKGVIWDLGVGKEKSIKVSAYNQYVLIIWDVVASWDYIKNVSWFNFFMLYQKNEWVFLGFSIQSVQHLNTLMHKVHQIK